MVNNVLKKCGEPLPQRVSMLVSVGAILALLVAVGPAHAATVQIVPAEDSYVDSSGPDGNFGWQTAFTVGGYGAAPPYPTCRTYLKFNLSLVPAGKEIVSALVYLKCSAVRMPPVQTGAYALDCDDWDENSVTWRNAPTASGDTPADSKTVAMGFNSWMVTRDVRAAYYGDGVYSVVMRVANEGGPAGADFYSSEHGTAANRPYLSVTYQDGAADSVVCEPQGGGNPSHPSTYWYDVTPSGSRCDFHVRVYDRDPTHYSNFVSPAASWAFEFFHSGDELWITWRDAQCLNPLTPGHTYRFQFDNVSPATWGDWATSYPGAPNPYSPMLVDSSWSHQAQTDGLGFRVHVPRAVDTFLVRADGSGDYPTIQAAIDAAWDGDTVELADGTFTGLGNRDLDFHGKAITVRSQSGQPGLCVIDCGGSAVDPHRGFRFHSGEDAESRVDGVRVMNGYDADPNGGGGAVLINSCSAPTFRNCAFTNSYAANTGGGVCYYQSSSPKFIGCMFVSNHSVLHGGGMCAGGDSPGAVLQACTFSSNIAQEDGAGLCAFSSIALTDCTFLGNQSPAHGGGMACMSWDLPPTLRRCLFFNNWAATAGGGLSAFGPGVVVDNGLFSGNTTGGSGGGLYCGGGLCDVTNATFFGQTASMGSGVAVGSATAALDNTIIAFGAGNAAGVDCTTGIGAWLTYSDVYGNAGGDWTGCIAGQLGVSGNIGGDPRFADADGPDNAVGTPDDNLRLRAYSPCVDAGDNGVVTTGVDLDGQARWVDDTRVPDTGAGTPPIVDMGAYEFRPGDYAHDGHVDLGDYAVFPECLFGPGVAPAPVPPATAGDCLDAFDFDGDGDVDLQDFGRFGQAFTG